MPKNYKFHDDDNFEESCYESEGETLYYPEKNIGSGTYAKARKFQSADGHRSLAVLKPKDKDDIDFIEVYNKYKFFKTLYPKQSIELIEREDTYRLVLPYIVGVPYEKLHLTNKRQQIKLFISAIEALKDCHNKGYIVLDLKADNIHYDMSSGKSYLLDGGISVKKDMLLDPNIFVVKTKEELISKKKKYTQIAPECWSQTPISAQKSMDVYALGSMMQSILEPSADINRLIQLCLAPKPEHRPTLHTLEKHLRHLLLHPGNQHQKAPHKKNLDNEQSNYTHALKILAEQSIVATKKQYKRLRKNNKIAKAIVDFNNACVQIHESHNTIKNIYFRIYKRETLTLMLRGAIEFKKEYPLLEKRAMIFINTQLFKEFTRIQAVKILTTLDSSKTELATTLTLSQLRNSIFQTPKKRPEHEEVKNPDVLKM
ncbi:protein kinase domain-containing protein [Fluoribacter gormanii]|uniref:Protein kinase domain n=1 Tax=Fluoribacter gormanii TaxID=464 RepID=A0A377GGP6_9GAMM|nr:protein kinase family protein [Fluoribacter gormanii]KTD02931.1 protein kinase [Fluoribacter gormanii]MCW8444725.1 protein kinase family protein [Fluoribacter gormanii]SIR85519.1 Protein kinase domain-containing protein [Fluoribacter gormanii]STO23715.1 Protein kinase domain [Fluoribacter gormanii]